MCSIKKMAYALLGFYIVIGCNNGPKVIQTSIPGKSQKEGSTGTNSSTSNKLHIVSVNEILQGSSYVFLNVTENKSKYWIATENQEFKIGETYYYQGGLLKTNFESKEQKKVFDTIYLVNRLVGKDHSKLTANPSNENILDQKDDVTQTESKNPTSEVITKKGSVQIAELVNDPELFEGKTIQLSGKCVKINTGIMNKNWIHLKDGSQDDYDLIVTSDTIVPIDAVITIKAKVVLDKDFGSGYKYSLILEDGVLVP